MRDVLGPGSVLGYCTNVHAGRTVDEIMRQLEDHACAVKESVSPLEPMGVGLWFPASAVEQLRDRSRVVALRSWLEERGLFAYTLNGFPYGDFHGEIVKHKVYRPRWDRRARFQYTLDLAVLLDTLLPEGEEGSISTLPIGWRGEEPDVERAAAYLDALAGALETLEKATGRLIHIDLEPEPGCVLDRSEDVVRLFELLSGETARRYIRVCHDVCHAAVMFEDQAEVLARYASAGIQVGKVQISSAVRAELLAEREDALRELRAFDEPRYLHQTVARRGDETKFYEDLGLALTDPVAREADSWRVHFHVPIQIERIGALRTTRDQIEPCLRTCIDQGVRHFEVETYAWGVLPGEMSAGSLASGIAGELAWVRDEVSKPVS